MKKSLLTLFIFFSLFSGAQNPLVKMWDKRFGGTDHDRLTRFQQTKDGGFILGGYSHSSNNGDRTEPNWYIWNGAYSDYWVVKIDSIGNKQWDKRYGGEFGDWLCIVSETSDGGYLLGGYSSNGISGDKTQPSWGGNFGYDYWIVKVDSLGNKLWDKDFGGTNDDVLYYLEQTVDGGYILGGSSYSGISGNKTESKWGIYGTDYWIIKIDSLGNKIWEKDYGGTDQDWLFSVNQTSDKGYILGGYSYSGLNGNKSDTSRGGFDYWIIKTDSLGNKQWDKTFGGSAYDQLYSLCETSDGGYILGGISHSDSSGDKTEALLDTSTWFGACDYWMVKIDSVGNKEWDKKMGGLNTEDEFGSITQTIDGGYLMAGTSYSNISGDKTEMNLSLEQTWVVKTDFIGNKQWDKTLHTDTATHDESGLAIQARSGCFIMANFTNSNIGGDKTQTGWGGDDYWIIKFCDSIMLPSANLTSDSTNAICPGTCTAFANLSFNASSYLWSFLGATPDTSTDINPQNICYANPGSYDVQLIATNANGSDTLLITNYITVYPFPPSQSITQNGDTLFAITGATTYQWYFNTNLINGATDYFYVATSSGDYNVVATDGNGCEVEAAVFDVIANTEVVKGSSNMMLFPNPVIDKVKIQKSKVKSGTALEIAIYNMIGERVLNVLPQINEDEQQIIDVVTLHSGMYWIEIKSGEKIFRSKFIKAGNR